MSKLLVTIGQAPGNPGDREARDLRSSDLSHLTFRLDAYLSTIELDGAHL